ncbi:hypothetical protein Tco_0178571 [Tanacetum coccineum]
MAEWDVMGGGGGRWCGRWWGDGDERAWWWCEVDGGDEVEMVTTAVGDGSDDAGGVGWRLLMMLGDDDGEVVRGLQQVVLFLRWKKIPAGLLDSTEGRDHRLLYILIILGMTMNIDVSDSVSWIMEKIAVMESQNDMVYGGDIWLMLLRGSLVLL